MPCGASRAALSTAQPWPALPTRTRRGAAGSPRQRPSWPRWLTVSSPGRWRRSRPRAPARWCRTRSGWTAPPRWRHGGGPRASPRRSSRPGGAWPGNTRSTTGPPRPTPPWPCGPGLSCAPRCRRRCGRPQRSSGASRAAAAFSTAPVPRQIGWDARPRETAAPRPNACVRV